VKRKYKRRRKNNYGLLLDGKDMVRRKDFGWTRKIIIVNDSCCTSALLFYYIPFFFFKVMVNETKIVIYS
jgi:hypothetical protein